MRASEAEREHAVDELRRHAAAGRLDVAELEERIEAAYGARTREELAELRSDLPRAVPADTGFGEHLRVYMGVQLLLVAIWALSGLGYFWPVWPAMGWGIGLMLHGSCVPGRHRGAWPRRTSRRRGIASS